MVEGTYIAPGYIDMHVHGGDGSDYMDGDTEAVRAANRACSSWDNEHLPNYDDRNTSRN